MSVVLAIEGIDNSDELSQQVVASAITDRLEEDHEIEDITLLEEIRLDDWTFGEPCPECGSAKLNVLEASDGWYRSQDGDAVWLKHGDSGSFVIDVLCNDCETTLYRHPAYTVLYTR